MIEIWLHMTGKEGNMTGKVEWKQNEEGFESQGKSGLDLMWKEIEAMDKFFQEKHMAKVI